MLSLHPPALSVRINASMPALPIGHAVKDLPAGSETAMTKSYAEQDKKVQTAYGQAVSKYQYEMILEEESIRASQEINTFANKRTLAITLLAMSVIGLVGILITTAIISMPILLFIAIPCAIALVPTSYCVHVYNHRYFELQKNVIEDDSWLPGGPRILPIKPKSPLLSEYDASKDLDLEKSRKQAQNKIKTASLEELASEWTSDQIVQYALLDEITPLTHPKRPQFYETCLQLFKELGSLKQAKGKISFNLSIFSLGHHLEQNVKKLIRFELAQQQLEQQFATAKQKATAEAKPI
jgi:hypothetical protein